MKKLILLALLIIPFSLIAQIEVDNRKTSMNDQTDQWMTKISSDSEMRINMMDLMVEKTKGNAKEMKKLANSISNSPGLCQMIIENYPERASGSEISIEPLGIVKEDIKVGKVYTTKPVAPKK